MEDHQLECYQHKMGQEFMKIRELLNESAISSADLQKKISATGLKLIPIPYDIVLGTKSSDGYYTSSKSSQLVNDSDRIIALVDVDGIAIPFYISTGEGGKENVMPGKWYPFFGIGTSGWFNKGSQELINLYYKSPKLKAIAHKLDSTLGDLRGVDYKIIPTLQLRSRGRPTINRNLSPVANNKEDPYPNIVSTLKKIGGTSLTTDKSAAPEPSTSDEPTPSAEKATKFDNTKQQYWHRNPDGSMELRNK